MALSRCSPTEGQVSPAGLEAGWKMDSSKEELMAKTRTLGITVLPDGQRFIDKCYLGVRIGLRIGAITQEQAEERLQTEMARVQSDVARKAHSHPTFTDCAARYIEQSHGKRSFDTIRWHVALVQSYLGHLEPKQVHDQTLEPFVKARLADGASATTINRSLEVVRTIPNRAARSYRDQDGRPWLEGLPPLITMLPENPRRPTRLPGKSRTRCSAGYHRTLRAWRSLRSTPGFATATYAACSGIGK